METQLTLRWLQRISTFQILIMLLAANSVLALDGDAAFVKVDNRRAAHQLEAGVCAAAVNHRFDEGKPRARHGVGCEAWGITRSNLVSGNWPDTGGAGPYPIAVTVTLESGAEYLWLPGNAAQLSTQNAVLTDPPDSTVVQTRRFTATQTSYYLLASTGDGLAVTDRIYKLSGNRTRGYNRFNDPNGVDNGVLLTDEIRASDGGRGKAWRIYPGNVPQEIPLNGHDVWGTARLIQCDAQLVLLRHGYERHYFAASAVDTATDRILLNALPNWVNGDEVEVMPDSDEASFTSGPNLGGTYYVRKAVASLLNMELYDTKAHAVDTGATTGRLDFSASVVTGRFYVERRALQPGFYGNNAPPLVMRANETETAFEVGFEAVPVAAEITASSGNVVTALNHQFVRGDSVSAAASSLKESTGPDVFITWPQFAAPQNDHTFRLYDTSLNALADDGTTGLQAVLDGQTGIEIYRTGASGAPMPGGNEAVYTKGRLLILNGKNLLISDPRDILHFTPFLGTLPANQSESGSPAALLVGGNDQVLILNESSVQEFRNLTGGTAEWELRDVTREYGCLAPLTALRVGVDSWFLSRRGVASVAITQFGEQQGVALPVSNDIVRRFDSVDWRYARLSCAGYWNNRVFVATALKGQDDPVNNGVLVYNLVNQGWEDLWQGDFLKPYAFSLLTIAGEERLTFATADGLVCYLSDDFQDFDGAIETDLLTRGYFGGQRVNVLKVETNADTWNPSYTVSLVTAGQGESVDLEPNPITYDRTRYVLHNTTAYDPDTSTAEQFDAPHREDYSPSAGELLVARLDAHQNITERFRSRLRDRAPQVRIVNTQGSLQLVSVELAARPIGGNAARET